MSTYSWLGGTALWTDLAYWSQDGGTASVTPDLADTVFITVSGIYTIVATNASAEFLTIDDPTATVEIQNLMVLGPGTGQELLGGLQNAGTVAVESAATLDVGTTDPFDAPKNFTYSNTGTISLAQGAILNIYADVASNQFGTIVNAGGLVNLVGTIDNTGRVFPSAALGNAILSGTIIGGTLEADGGTLQFAYGLLSGVTYIGNMSLHSVVHVGNGFTLEPQTQGTQVTIDLSGGGLVGLYSLPNPLSQGPDPITQAETLDNILVRNHATHGLFGFPGTLGPAVTIEANLEPNGWMTFAGEGGQFLGTLSATGSLDIGATNNKGTITVSGAGSVATMNDSGFANNGTIIVDGARFSTYSGASIAGAGTIALANGATAELGASYGQQVFALSGSPSNLAFDHAAGTNTILGFAPGDTIELVGIGANAAFSNSTLSLTNGPVLNAHFVLPGVPGNAIFDTFTDTNLNTFITETIPCFAAGTRIATPAGPVAIEHLRVGDQVLSIFGGTAPIQWIGHRTIGTNRHPNPKSVYPIRIQAHALADGIPSHDLYLSPEHALHLDGQLIPVHLLVNGASISQEPRQSITYWHLELPQHDVLLAEATPCESYLDTGNRTDFDTSLVTTLHPSFTPDEIWRAHACAPQCRQGPPLTRIRARLATRAASASRRTAA